MEVALEVALEVAPRVRGQAVALQARGPVVALPGRRQLAAAAELPVRVFENVILKKKVSSEILLVLGHAVRVVGRFQIRCRNWLFLSTYELFSKKGSYYLCTCWITLIT